MTQMTPEQARALVAPVYEALTRPATKPVRELLEKALSPSWRSHGSNGDVKDREHFVQMVTGLGRGVPDMAFEIREVVVSGNRVLVRSEVTGTPAGEFMGVPHTGRGFRILAMDLHTVEDGRSVEVHHVEDWMSAVRQLKGA